MVLSILLAVPGIGGRFPATSLSTTKLSLLQGALLEANLEAIMKLDDSFKTISLK